MKRVLPYLFISVFLFGCQSSSTPETHADGSTYEDEVATDDTQPSANGFSEADIEANAEIEEKFKQAMVGADMDLMLSLYTEDAVLMPPNMPEMTGHEAIKEFFSTMPTPKACDFEILDMTGFGDYCYVRGRVTMTMDIPNVGEVTEEGKFVEIRQRQADGSWKITIDMYNTDMPMFPTE